MIQARIVVGVPFLHFSKTPCISYFQRKLARTKITKSFESCVSEPLALLHTDIYGPFKLPFLDGS
jgi:hypothetical protein